MIAVQGLMLPSSLIKPVIGRTFAVCPNAEQAAEGIERVEAPIEAEHELIEVGLQMLRLDAPVRVAALAERRISWRGVRNDHCSRLDGGLHKAAQGLFATVRDDFQAQP